ncbi:MAG: lysoplasmalogenase [Chloroflexi bacterium]|nr:lysoplasmalogenase [Chloroflexota bacterium]
MFPLPYAQPWALILYALFALELALLAGGLAFGRLNAEQTCRLPRPLRVLLSALLLLAAFLGWQAGARGTPVQIYASLIFLGMSAGFLGDLIMARLIPVPERVVFGMITFGLGHLFYLGAFLHVALRSGWAQPEVLALTLAGMLGLCGWLWYAHIRQPGGSRVLNMGSLLYGLLVGAMAALAIMLACRDSHYLSLAAGTLLFWVSDLVLGNWVIRGRVWKSVNDVVWATYVSGQLLIVYSVAAALNAWR